MDRILGLFSSNGQASAEGARDTPRNGGLPRSPKNSNNSNNNNGRRFSHKRVTSNGSTGSLGSNNSYNNLDNTSNEEPSQTPVCVHVQTILPLVCLASLLLCIFYVIAAALFPSVPQPWERYFEIPGVRSSRTASEVVSEEDGEDQYDCNLLFSSAWSLAQRAWCCRFKNKGCPVDNAHDCQEDLARWKIAWSTEKQHFCCGYALEGCKDFPSLEADQDCVYELEDWQNVWSEEKKDHCCDLHNFGCQATKEAASSGGKIDASAFDAEKSGLGCLIPCDVGGYRATCKNRIEWLAQHPVSEGGFMGQPDACNEAYRRVTSDCTVCSACTAEMAGCATR